MLSTVLLILAFASFLLAMFGVAIAGVAMLPTGLMFLTTALLVEPARILVVRKP